MTIILLNKTETLRRRDELAALLGDAVRHGASVGFTRPLPAAEARAYWRQVAAAVGAGEKVLLAACDARGRLVGSAQLALESRANGRHRAEVQKVMVRHRARGRGLGAALMARLEEAARADGRTLLFLDTSVGAAGAGAFYRKLGYTYAGGIPDYAATPDGRLVPNAIFYKRLRKPRPRRGQGRPARARA